MDGFCRLTTSDALSAKLLERISQVMRVQYAADSTMPTSTQFANPSKRPALRDAKSIVLTTAVFSLVLLCFAVIMWFSEWLESFPLWIAFFLLFGIAIVGSLALFAAAHAARNLLPKHPKYPDEFGLLELRGDDVVQFDDSAEIARIDATRPYEYEVLDCYDAKLAVFQLHQDGNSLTFRISDPGAPQIVNDVMGLTWPPPPRHAGRSYPPPAAQ